LNLKDDGKKTDADAKGRLTRALEAIAQWSSEHKRLVIALQLALIGGIVAASFAIAFTPSIRDQFEALSYLGAWLSNLIVSATVIFPAPGIILTCVYATDPNLNIWLLSLVSGIGSALGETVSYALGYIGRGFVEKNRLVLTLERWIERFGGPTLFVLSVAPLPFFDIAGILAGVSRMPLYKFYFWVVPGKFIKFVILIWVCQAGIGWLQTLFGV